MAHVLRMKCENITTPIQDIAYKVRIEMGADLAFHDVKTFDNAKVAFMVLEKYYWRIGGHVSLSILLTESGGVQTAEVIGSGGGGGIVKNSWGATKSFVKAAAAQLEKHGFR